MIIAPRKIKTLYFGLTCMLVHLSEGVYVSAKVPLEPATRRTTESIEAVQQNILEHSAADREVPQFTLDGFDGIPKGPGRQGNVKKKKNIVFILADDMGWNDVSFHGSTQIPTPNIDALASSGVILHNHYAQPMCSPSRAALLTGKYPFKTGMQNYVIKTAEPWGLPLEYRILPQFLRDQGYATHIIGKWHMGMLSKAYLPLQRGFDTFMGYLNGFIDYYTHEHIKPKDPSVRGFDWTEGNEPAKREGYATHLFTERARQIIRNHDVSKPLFLYIPHLAPHSACERDPFQAPSESVKDFKKSIQDEMRSTYAAMVKALDDSVAEIFQAVHEKGILNDTVFVFSSDNGGQTSGVLNNTGSNWPLRGEKRTLFEGGTRVASFVWSADIQMKRRVEHGLMHFVDWLPTLYRLAGGNPANLKDIDGKDQWDMISSGRPSKRDEIVYNINYADQSAAIRTKRYKVMIGPRGANKLLNGWRPASGYGGETPVDVEIQMDKSKIAEILKNTRNWWKNDNGNQYPLVPFWQWRWESVVTCGNQPYVPCDPTHTVCLFDLEKDPCEMNNIVVNRTQEAKQLIERVLQLSKVQHKINNLPMDPHGVPKSPDGYWKPWL